MKALSKIDKLKSLIIMKITDITTLPDNSVKLDVYTDRNIHGLYRYIEMVGSKMTLNTLGQLFHQFGSSSIINNDTATL